MAESFHGSSQVKNNLKEESLLKSRIKGCLSECKYRGFIKRCKLLETRTEKATLEFAKKKYLESLTSSGTRFFGQ